jgi:hypothetical protein
MSSTSSQLSKRVLQCSGSSIVSRNGLKRSPIYSYSCLLESRRERQFCSPRRDELRFFSSLGSRRNLNPTPLAKTSNSVENDGNAVIRNQTAELGQHSSHSSQNAVQVDESPANSTDADASIAAKPPLKENPRRNNGKGLSRNAKKRHRRKLARLLVQNEEGQGHGKFRLVTQPSGGNYVPTHRKLQASDMIHSSRMVIAANVDVIDRATGALSRMSIKETVEDTEVQSEDQDPIEGAQATSAGADEISGPGKLFDEKQLFKTNTYDLLFRSRDLKERSKCSDAGMTQILIDSYPRSNGETSEIEIWT